MKIGNVCNDLRLLKQNSKSQIKIIIENMQFLIYHAVNNHTNNYLQL